MKNVKVLSIVAVLVLMMSLSFALSTTAYAAEVPAETATQAAAETATQADEATGTKAVAAAVVVAIASAAGAIAMGMAIAKCAESMARQPEAAGKINSAMMLGLVFIETLIIYALIVAILIIFVL